MRKLKLLAMLASTSVLAGCVGVDQSQPMWQTIAPGTPGVETSGSGDYTLLESVSFESTTTFNKDAVAGCIAENVRNNDHTLQSTSSYVGPATGRLYNLDHTKEVGGGNLLEYVGEDRVIASGNLTYTFTSGFVPINDIVRFTLAVKETESGTSYQFRNLERAQQDTGVVANAGYGKIYMKAGGRSQLIYDNLSGLQRKIDSCVQ